MGKAVVDRERCYAWLGDVCRACYTNCPLPEKAIYFEVYTQVVVDEEKCVGCGVCEYVCVTEPDAAIKILTPKQFEEWKRNKK